MEHKTVSEDGGSGTFDEGDIPWHDAGEALIEYLIVANAYAEGEAVLKDLRVDCESHLLASMGESAKHADLIVMRPPMVSIAGPIGEGLGICSSIEFKPETDNYTMMTLIRSWAYTLQAAYKRGEDTGQAPEKPSDLATLIVTYHKPKALFKKLVQEGAKIRESKNYKGVYILEGSDVLPTRFIVTRELDYAGNGYEWFRWLRTGLTLEDGRAFMNRWREAGDKEKPMATLVAYVALRANPRVMGMLIKEADKTMSDALSEMLLPLYGDKLEELEQKWTAAVQKTGELTLANSRLMIANGELVQQRDKAVRKTDELTLANLALVQERDAAVQKTGELVRERDAAVQKTGELVQERDAAVQKTSELVQQRNEAFQTIAKLVAGAGNGGIDAETLAKAQELLAASSVES